MQKRKSDGLPTIRTSENRNVFFFFERLINLVCDIGFTGRSERRTESQIIPSAVLKITRADRNPDATVQRFSGIVSAIKFSFAFFFFWDGSTTLFFPHQLRTDLHHESHSSSSSA